jgi:hypothetical protein
MIDGPNLIAGVVLGVRASLGFLFWESAREHRKKKMEAHSEWLTAASEMQLLLWQKDTTAATLYTVKTRPPLDRWRRILGPDDSRDFENLLGAYGTVEVLERQPQDPATLSQLTRPKPRCIAPAFASPTS